MRLFYYICLTLIVLSMTPARGNEVRVLIDVSGSMRQNDPQNLRIPALKLLLELLPPDSKAGVWLFAGEPEILIAPTKVDASWKQNAAKVVERIHSKGRLTDIEKALQTSLDGWEQTDFGQGRHLILLTDGMVDVQGGRSRDQTSRERVLEHLIPRLQTLGVHVHTIALSDQADHLLLKQLAVATDGKNKVSQTAEALQRTFLDIFKSAVPHDTVPLNGNQFKIDPSIEEFSLLVFRRPNSPGTKLIKPSGETWSQDQYPDNVRWHHEEGYDLVTVSHPMPGAWRLEAEMDPDNQVMVVTDLKLEVTPLPNYLLKDETVTLTAKLTEYGKRITRENFLRLVQFSLKHDGIPSTGIPLQEDQNQQGLFHQSIDQFDTPGGHTIVLTVDGKTFQRTWEQNIEVISNPLELEVAYPKERPGQILLSLTPDARIIDPKTFKATAIISGAREPVEKEFSTTDWKQWQLLLNAPPSGLDLTANFQLTAMDLDGKPLALVLKPTILQGLPPTAEDMLGEEEESLLEEEDEALLLEEELEQENDWFRAALIATAINLALLVGGFLVWRWLQSRTRRQQEALLSRLAGEVGEASP